MKLEFEWDEEKERINIAKHGIDFETASHVFLDPNRMEYYDEAHSSGGDRSLYRTKKCFADYFGASSNEKREDGVLWQLGSMY